MYFAEAINVNGTDYTGGRGLCNAVCNTVTVLRYDSERFKNASFFGCKADKYFLYSVLLHEMAHCVSIHVAPDMVVHVSEYVVDAATWALMPEALAQQLRSIWPSWEGHRFFDESKITFMSYMRNPQEFHLASYFYCDHTPHIFVHCLKSTKPFGNIN